MLRVIVSICVSLDLLSAPVNAATDVSARLWDVGTGKLIRSYVGHNRPVTAATFSPDGAVILTGSMTDELRLWATSTTNQLKTFRSSFGRDVKTLAYSADGKTFLVGSEMGPLVLLDAKTGEVIRKFVTRQSVVAAGFVADGKRVLGAGNRDASVYEWETATGEQTRTYQEKWWSGLERVTLTSDGKPRSWWEGFKGGRVPGDFQVPADSLADGFNDKATISPDGRRAFTWSGSRGLQQKQGGNRLVAHWARIWDLEAGKVIWFSGEFPGQRAQFAFSPGGTQFVAGCHEGGAQLWDSTTGTVIRSIGTEKQSFEQVAFSPNGKLILSYGIDKMMRLWEVQSGKQIQSLSVPKVTCVTFSPDGTKILTGGMGEWSGN